MAQWPTPTSPIPIQSDKNAFAAREAEQLAGESVALRKTRLVLRQLREIRRVIAPSMRDLHL